MRVHLLLHRLGQRRGRARATTCAPASRHRRLRRPRDSSRRPAASRRSTRPADVVGGVGEQRTALLDYLLGRRGGRAVNRAAATRLDRRQPDPDRRGDRARGDRRGVPLLQREPRAAVRPDVRGRPSRSRTRRPDQGQRGPDRRRPRRHRAPDRRDRPAATAPPARSCCSSSSGPAGSCPSTRGPASGRARRSGSSTSRSRAGRSHETFPTRATLPLTAAQAEPVELDEFFDMFDEPDAHRVGRQPRSSTATRSPGAATTSTAAFRELGPLRRPPRARRSRTSSRRSRVRRAVPGVRAGGAARSRRSRSPRRELFDGPGHARSARSATTREALKDAISGGPPALDVATRELPAQAPFVEDSDRAVRRLRPAFRRSRARRPTSRRRSGRASPRCAARPALNERLVLDAPLGRGRSPPTSASGRRVERLTEFADAARADDRVRHAGADDLQLPRAPAPQRRERGVGVRRRRHASCASA